MACATPDLRLPSQPKNCHYTATTSWLALISHPAEGRRATYQDGILAVTHLSTTGLDVD